MRCAPIPFHGATVLAVYEYRRACAVCRMTCERGGRPGSAGGSDSLIDRQKKKAVGGGARKTGLQLWGNRRVGCNGTRYIPTYCCRVYNTQPRTQYTRRERPARLQPRTGEWEGALKALWLRGIPKRWRSSIPRLGWAQRTCRPMGWDLIQLDGIPWDVGGVAVAVAVVLQGR